MNNTKTILLTLSLLISSAISCMDHNNMTIHEAASAGNTDRVGQLIKQNPELVNLKQNDSVFPTPLHCAAAEGHTKITLLLLQYGAIVDALSELRETPLDYAVTNGHTEVVRLLLQHQASVDGLKRTFKTPLHIAAKNGYTEIARLLLQHGATIDALDHENNTPLHYAAEHGHMELAKLLLLHGANIDLENGNGKTLDELFDHNQQQPDRPEFHKLLFWWPDYKRYRQRQLLSFAMVQYVPNNILSEELYTYISQFLKEHWQTLTVDQIFDLAQNERNFQESELKDIHNATQDGNFIYIKKVINENPKLVNAVGTHRKTPLHLAVERGYVEIVRFLLQLGANVSALDSLQRTPLFYAALHSDIKYSPEGPKYATIALILLKEYNADVNVQDINQETPLHFAARNNCTDLVHLLLQYGANTNLKNNRKVQGSLRKGNIPLDVANHNYRADGTRGLLKDWPLYKRYIQRQLLSFCMAQHERLGEDSPAKILQKKLLIYIFKFVRSVFMSDSIEKIHDIAKQEKKWEKDNLIKCIQHAAKNGNVMQVNKLLESFINDRYIDKYVYDRQWTLLHAASYLGEPDIVQLLLANGANAGTNNSSWNNPLQLTDNVEIAQLLLHHGCQIPKFSNSDKKSTKQPSKNILLKDWPSYQSYRNRQIAAFAPSFVGQHPDVILQNVAHDLRYQLFNRIVQSVRTACKHDTIEQIHTIAKHERSCQNLKLMFKPNE